ncbi:MAG: PAS domain S-box protein [Proteobacteria bacterium]|nr:PAS domain S-box protein [Pseudomonadota bacterium]
MTTTGAPALPAGIAEQTVFRSLFAAYPDALLLVDLTGTIVLANPTAASLLGYTTDELAGLPVDVLVPDAIRPRHAAFRAGYARAPQPRPMGTQMDLVARRKDGSEVMVEIALSPLHDHGLPLVVAAIRGIGAYPRVRQALQRARYSEQLARFGHHVVNERDTQILLDQAPAIAAEALEVEVATVYLLEPAQGVLRVASGVGPLPGEEVGARIPYLPDSSPGLVLSKGEPLIVPDYRLETRFVVPPAYLDAGLVSALAVPVSDRGRTIGALAVRSLRAQRFGDEELRFLVSLANLLATSLQRATTEEQLNHAQRLESVGQLTGGIAHDFNNLLTVIQGNLQVLEELPSVAGDARSQQLVGAAMRAARRSAELTAKLLAFSSRQVLQPSALDVGALIRSLADMLRRTLDQRVRIEVDVAPATPPVLADAGQLESALLNIAINARDAMPDGGRLRFHAEVCRSLDAVREELDDAEAAPEGYVAIAIADNGSGMTDEVKERAFEPFFTTKGAGRGTGLGLSTVYGFAKQSRGAIAIDTTPGAGTVITLYLPCAQGLPETDADAAGQDVPPGLRVLLVEDDAEVRAVVRTFLDALGCAVTAAASAEQALLAIEPQAPYDVLLSDIALGAGMRGTQLAHEARRRLPHLAIVLMSGYSSELLEADRDSPSDWELLRKPYSREELAGAIARVIVGAR